MNQQPDQNNRIGAEGRKIMAPKITFALLPGN
jgi:hypothetical protein